MNSTTAKRRIFILSPTESELTSRGKRHPNLARYLSARGWDVNYISSNFNHAEKCLFSDDDYREAIQRLPYRLSLINVGVYKRNLSLQRVLWHQRFAHRCHRVLDGVLHEDDILIVPSRPPELIYAVARLKRYRGCRIVLDIRDIWPDALSESSWLLRRGFGIYCDFFLQRSVAQFNDYICVAPSFLKWLHRYAPTARSTFIPLGFDENRWGSEPPPRQQQQQDNFLRLIYCGTLTNQFDIMPVLKAMAQRRGRFHLTLVGENGSGERYADVIDFIRSQNLDSEVTVLGLLPADQLVQELPRHDITIVPMVSGALPNKVFDSIAAGLPMISLGAGDSSAFVKQHNLGWTASFTPEAFCAVLDQLTPENIAQKAENVLRHRLEYMQRILFEKYESVVLKLAA